VSVGRREVDAQASIDTEDGKIIFAAKDVEFKIAESVVNSEFVPGARFSIVTMKQDLENSVATLAAEINATVETEISGIKSDLAALETNVNTKVSADIDAVTQKLDALDEQVKQDVKSQLDEASADIADSVAVSAAKNAAQDATIAADSKRIADLENLQDMPNIYSAGTSVETLYLGAGGGQEIIFNGANFGKNKVEFSFNGKTVAAKSVSVDPNGAWIKIVSPEMAVDSDPCKGGDGKDTTVKIRIYGIGSVASKFVERVAIIRSGHGEFGDGRDGDFVVDKPRNWNENALGMAFRVKADSLVSENAWSNEVVTVKKIRTYKQIPANFFKCGQVILIANMGHDDRAAEHYGRNAMCILQDHTNDGAAGGIITCRDPVQLLVKRKDIKTTIIMQRVPQYNHVKFQGDGKFVGRLANFHAGNARASGFVTHTGIVAFLAQKVTLQVKTVAIDVSEIGYQGATAQGANAQDAKSKSITGGSAGQNANPAGCGHNRRGGYGGAGCGKGLGGDGGNSGGGWAYGGWNGRGNGGDKRGGGGGGGSDFSCTGAGGGGAHCSGQGYSKAADGGAWNSGGHVLVLGGGAAAGAGGGSSEGRGGYANGKGGNGGRHAGGNGGHGGTGGGIAIVGVAQFTYASGSFIDASGGVGGAGGGGSAGNHKDGGGGGGQGADGAAGGAVVVRSGDGNVIAGVINVRGGAGGGGGGGAGVPNQHNPSASGGGGAGAGKGGGGGAGTNGASNGGKGGVGASKGVGAGDGQYSSGGKKDGGGGGCSGGCGGRGGAANKGGYSSSTSCNRGADASGLNAGKGGQANTGCGGDGNQAAGGGGGGSGGEGTPGYLAIV